MIRSQNNTAKSTKERRHKNVKLRTLLLLYLFKTMHTHTLTANQFKSTQINEERRWSRKKVERRRQSLIYLRIYLWNRGIEKTTADNNNYYYICNQNQMRIHFTFQLFPFLRTYPCKTCHRVFRTIVVLLLLFRIFHENMLNT